MIKFCYRNLLKSHFAYIDRDGRMMNRISELQAFYTVGEDITHYNNVGRIQNRIRC